MCGTAAAAAVPSVSSVSAVQAQVAAAQWRLPIRSAQVLVPGIVAVAVIGRMISKSTDELCASGWYLSQAKQLWVYHTVAAVSTRSGAAGRSEAADYDTRCSCDSQKPEAQLQYSRPLGAKRQAIAAANYS